MEVRHYTVVTTQTSGPRQRLDAAGAWTMTDRSTDGTHEQWAVTVPASLAPLVEATLQTSAEVLVWDRVEVICDAP